MNTSPLALLFDMDGVLLRSEEIWFKLVEEAGLRFRGRAITREEFAPTFGQGTTADVGHFGLACTVAELDAFYVEGFGRHADGVWVDPEAAELLRTLRGRGKRLAVVTNTVSPLAERLLRAAGLRDWFETVACADQVPHAKPAPDLLHLACRSLGVGLEAAWMIGDSRYDRAAAQAAGIRFVGFGLEGDLRVEALRELAGLVG